ncbi:uncharacterized protein LOC100571852 isoform X2 [Acyrthosiphon pisum]|uniref:THAP-type domain-containing protein n=1 Tax=Acyrthosiphon pisum TaxID=7029 RepID=A0A8R2D6I1_ACYPI|nr:uncharacterized protein LOC100571852 isoform X2 [Acyrthosiphon pisum]|eukprot:XP_016663745.1 PREDICTED: uncharacterized protein LOC100571852 isoform X2 [Acyrthosiphon pisum]
MHKCIVCFNTYDKTKGRHRAVIYHGFPKDPCMRRKWLRVFGIDRCYDWQRICSDHFLEENYKPGKKKFLFSNAIPQPYHQNGFPSDYATQSNDVVTGNNVILPMEQNIIQNLAYYDESDCIESEFYREEQIGNSVINNFKSRRSSTPTGNNEDMSNKNMPDHTLRSGLLCSVNNCFNKHSKNISFFGYPKDLTLRKMWIERCRIKQDLDKIVTSTTRVCSIHFKLDCFMNTELKNRLKPGSVPSLFLDNDIINTKNIPSTSSRSNKKSSTSSSNNLKELVTSTYPIMFIPKTGNRILYFPSHQNRIHRGYRDILSHDTPN